MWGRYELIEKVHVGPVAETWRARAGANAPIVALKRLSPQLSGSPSACARFAAISAQLRVPPHSDLVAAGDAGSTEQQPYFARAWLEGPSAAQLMQALVRRSLCVLPPPLALTLGLQVTEILEKLHASALVHGHLVGRNIFVLPSGVVKLTDAGLTRVIEPAPGESQAELPRMPDGELAPEQRRGQSIGEASDVYAVGALLFEWLTGSRPPGRAGQAELLACVAARQVPPNLTAVIARALEQEPAARQPSVKVLAGELKSIALMGFMLNPMAFAGAIAALVDEEQRALPGPVIELFSRFGIAAPGSPPPMPRRPSGSTQAVSSAQPTEMTSVAQQGAGNKTGRLFSLDDLDEDEPPTQLAIQPPAGIALSNVTEQPPSPAAPGDSAFKDDDSPTRLLIQVPLSTEAPPTGPGIERPLGDREVDTQEMARAASLGDERPESSAGQTNFYGFAQRSPLRFVPFVGGLAALAVMLVVVARTLVPSDHGTVVISSTPTGADVYVNGELTEQPTPARLSLPVGKTHTIDLQLPGWLPWSQTVTPSSETPQAIRGELRPFPEARRRNN